MEARLRCGLTRMANKVSGKDRGRQALWRRCGTTGMDTEAEKLRDGNRKDVGRHGWMVNGLEERQWTGQILKRNDYQTEGVLLL